MGFLPSRKAEKELGITANTLRKWANEEKIKFIKTPTGQRLYDISSLTKKERAKICYCRVSSSKQRNDLERQVEFMRKRFPDYEIIEDVGSGLNYKRKGFIALLERICGNDVEEVVVAHKDRLCRFGFELIKWLIEQNSGKLLVLDKTEQSPQEELVDDILSIIHVFSCRINGFRKYGSQIKKDKDLSKFRTKKKIT